VLIQFNRSVRVVLWGRELQNARAGEVYDVPLAVAAILMAQGCGQPPTLAHATATADGRVA
jgi:hypothetical protein